MIARRGLQTVLFVCERNAGRSQMAAALFNQVADPSLARALSAGLNAAAAVPPRWWPSCRRSVSISQT